MNRLVPVALVVVGVLTAGMIWWLRYETEGRDKDVNCEIAALQRIVRDVPIGASREDLMGFLADDWQVDAGVSRVEALGFTRCGWGQEGHVSARFEISEDQVASCILVGDVAGVKKACALPTTQR